MTNKEIKLKIIAAGHKAVLELIKVAEDAILNPDMEGDDLSADKLKNAAASKRLAIFDAFDILNRIEAEKTNLQEATNESSKLDSKQGWAERRAK